MKKVILFTIVALTANFVNAQWQQTTGPIRPAVSLLINGGDIFAGCSSVSTYNGVYKSSDNGSNWLSVNNNGINYDVKALVKNDAYIFAAQNNEVYLTSNNGTNWTNVSTGLPSYSVNALSESGGNIYAGTFGVYYTTDNGLIWNKISTGWNDNIYSLAVQGQTIFAGTLTNGIHLTTNNGLTWTTVNTGLPSSPISAIAIFGSTVLAGTNVGVYQSTNMGANWTATNLTDPISSFTIVGSNIFAGSSTNGVFLSTSNGSNWYNINEGLTLKTVASLAANSTYLFAGLYGSYVCKRLLSEVIFTGINELQNSTSIEIFPNPTTDIITISFKNLFKETQVSIHNISGQQIFTGTFKNKNSIDLNVSSFPTGIYFLNIKTDIESFQRKIVIQ